MKMMNEATQRQVTAAQPDRSTWLTANAGSGKTRVLTDRVARLLLAGADPQNILCLTYTKAAAGEMQNRLFKTLGEWAMMPDAELVAELRKKGVPGDLDLAAARRLFARAIETPGGLKIQTIHAFCASLLRRFPVEAGVSPQFSEIDDRTAELLRMEVLDNMALDQGAAGATLRELLRWDASGLDNIASEVIKNADAFEHDQTQELANFLGADPDKPLNDMLVQGLHGAQDIIKKLVPVMGMGSVTDQKNADKLAKLQSGSWNFERFMALVPICLFGGIAKAPFGAKIGKVPTKKLRTDYPDLAYDFDDVMQVVEELRPKVLAQRSFEQTRALHNFAQHFIPALRGKMQARGYLRFDDLIMKARDLLCAPEVAAWVLWRLDGGIDHILVDEAQDTSPIQWEVIRLLAQEFAAGRGARDDRLRTLFVVGDRKQSIYSFQGADPAGFNKMKEYFAERLEGGDVPLYAMSLDHSFRSSRAILDLVDRVFSGEASEGLEANVHHVAFHEQLAGRVDLWPPVLADEEPEEDSHWTDPVDQLSARAPEIKLAEQIAARIRHMVDHEHLPFEQDGRTMLRPITEGDVLILVRKRGLLFEAILRAAKQQGLRVAGADRLRLGGELAVRDITALLQFLALPEDDLALAIALKSPIFGWTETQVYDLAQGRKGYLWAALRHREDHSETREVLRDLRDNADYLRPFELISRLLVRHGGREKILARLGAEAEEGIDALLAQAMAYESTQVPSLTGFLIWLEAEDVEIKRQQGSGDNALRVMSVHGAKGLEAPIVIMPDTGKRRAQNRGGILREESLGIWRPTKDLLPDAVQPLVELEKQSELEESRRLLYVGLTRAERWLIIAAAKEVDETCWYGMVEGAMGAAQGVSLSDGIIKRIEHGNWQGEITAVSTVAELPTAQPPMDTVPPMPARQSTLSPSDLGGAKVLPGDYGAERNKDEAMARGTIMHRLLEYLPQVSVGERAALAWRIAPDHPDLATQALALMERPELGDLFARGLAEVGVTGKIKALGSRTISGQIDLLIEEDARVLAIDFKSNQLVPDNATVVPEGILRQMGAYADALAQVYPDKTIETAVLWTATAKLMPLDPELISAALARANVT